MTPSIVSYDNRKTAKFTIDMIIIVEEGYAAVYPARKTQFANSQEYSNENKNKVFAVSIVVGVVRLLLVLQT